MANTFLFILQGSALADLGRLDRSWFLYAIVKKLLKSDSICESYAQMKKGPVFFWLAV